MLRMSKALVSFCLEGAMALRRHLYKVGAFSSEGWGLPVISVGNLDFGGTGKTPLVIWLCQYLSSQGLRVAVVTRGHKSRMERSRGLLSSQHLNEDSALLFGDEAVVMATHLKDVPIVVGKNRRKNFAWAFRATRPHVVVLDDGLQHLKIDREANLLLVDATRALSGYHMPPLGGLREGVGAMREADFIVISRACEVSARRMEALKGFLRTHARAHVPMAEMTYRCTGIFNHHLQRVGDGNFLEGKKILAVCAVARPQSFYQMIEDMGGAIVNKIPFRDHHRLTKRDLLKVHALLAKVPGAVVVMTEKDFVKLSSEQRAQNFYFLKIEVEFVKGGRSLKNYINRICQWNGPFLS